MLGVGKVLDLVRGRSGDGETSVYEFRSQQDQELRETLDKMRENRKGLVEMNEVLRESLDLQPDKGRSFMAKFLALVTPKWLYPRMSTKLLKLIAEEANPLELIENLFRTRINTSQDSIRDCARIGIVKQGDHEELLRDLQKAEDENWSAQQLQQHITGKADIKVYDEVKTLLNNEFKLLSDEEKESCKQHLLLQLTNNLRGSESLIKLIAKVLSSELSIWQAFVSEYYAYRQFYVPLAVIRDNAEVMNEGSTVMYAAREALLTTAEKSVSAIITALEAKAHISRYSIASPEMTAALEGERNRLEACIAEVKAIEAAALVEGQKHLLEEGQNSARQLTDGDAVDAEIVGEPRITTMPAMPGHVKIA